MKTTDIELEHPDRRQSLAEPRDVKAWRVPSGTASSNVDFGVVVGVEHYPYFRSLRGAANDAQNFRDWLCDGKGGGLKKKNVKLILSNLERETPVQDEIDRELLGILDAAHRYGGARRLYFYFSGHGAMHRQRVNYDVALLLTRWSSSLSRLALSTDLYSSKLCGAGLFAELAIFVDCCRGLSVPVVGVPPSITKQWSALCATPSSTRKFIAYATEAGQPAYECQEADSWQGIFTQCLLILLRGESGGIHAGALKDRLESDVEKRARERGFIQRPHVENGFHQHSCFGRHGRPQLVELRFMKRRGTVVLRDGTLQVVARHKASDQPWRLMLPVGIYQIDGGGEGVSLFRHTGGETSHDV